MEMLSTIEINDRNKADFERFCNLDNYRTDEYTTAKLFCEGKDDLSEYCCPLCGGINEIYIEEDFSYDCFSSCKVCHANLSIEVCYKDETITAHAERPVGE